MRYQPGSRAYVEAECCPCCYDGELHMSTGIVLGGMCIVCKGTGKRPPKVADLPPDHAGGDNG